MIISRITFGDCRVHIFPTTFLEIAVFQGLKDSTWQTGNTLNMVAFVRPKILKTPTWRLQLICKELNSKTLSASALEFPCVVFNEGPRIPV